MFNLSKFPSNARSAFQNVPILWPNALFAAIGGGITDLDDLTNLVFFMHHKERMTGQTAKPLDPKETNFDKLAKEWRAFRKMIEPTVAEAVSGAAPSMPISSNWRLSPEERHNVIETGGKALLTWAEKAPTAKAEAEEFRPAPGQRERFKTIFAWKSQQPNRTCLANPDQRLQLVLMLRDDIEFWRERTKNEREAVIKQSAFETSIRAYRQHVIHDKLCPEAARRKEIELGKMLTLQMIAGLYAAIPVPTNISGTQNFKSLGELISGLANLLHS